MKISINDILSNMPENLSNIEKVRYIYLQIGKIFSYEREYLYTQDFRVANDMYNDVITISMINNRNYQNKIVSTCKQTAEVECDVINSLREKNICAKIVGYDPIEEKHVAVIVTIDDKNYYLDINADLYKIQKGMRTVGFAKSSIAVDRTECDTISSEDLEKIDKKLGYCKYGIYTDDVIDMLRKEMSDEENLKEYIREYIENPYEGEVKEDIIYRFKIDFIFNYLKNNLPEEEKMKSIEISKYYHALFKRLLTEEERKNNKIGEYDIYLKNDKQERKESIIYIIKMRNIKLYYLYKDEERGFVQTNFDTVRQMCENGQIEFLNDLDIEEER